MAKNIRLLEKRFGKWILPEKNSAAETINVVLGVETFRDINLGKWFPKVFRHPGLMTS